MSPLLWSHHNKASAHKSLHQTYWKTLKSQQMKVMACLFFEHPKRSKIMKESLHALHNEWICMMLGYSKVVIHLDNLLSMISIRGNRMQLMTKVRPNHNFHNKTLYLQPHYKHHNQLKLGQTWALNLQALPNISNCIY